MKHLQSLSYKTLFTILFFSLAGIVFFLKIGGKTTKVSAAWWDDSWHYRKAISITNSSGSNLTDFQVAVSIGTSQLIADGKMQTDCDDIRLTDINGNLLPYWIEENNPGCNQLTDTKIWLKANSLPTSGATVYLYYGNTSANNNENGDNVFEYFDNFNDANKTNSNWTATGTGFTITNGNLYHSTTLEPSNSFSSYTVNNSSSFTNGIIESRLKPASCGSSYGKGLTARYTDDNNQYVAGLEAWTANQTHIGKRVGSGWTNLDQDSLTCDTNTWYSLQWTLNGTNQYLTANGVASSAVDSSFSSGKVGIEIDNRETPVGAYWDYFFVHKYASSDPTPTLQSEEIGTAPIAYWKFDEGVGTTAYDSSSNQNHGIISGATYANEDQCISGKCLIFDGVDDNVNANFNYPSTWNDAFSISTWVYVPSSAIWSNGYYGNIISRGSYTGSHGLARGSSDNQILMWVRSDNGTISVAGTITRDKWHYITGTWNGTEIELFINGQSKGKTGSARTGVPTTTSWTIATAKAFSGAGGNWFTGKIDEAKIYPYARTADQIKQDYNSRGSMSGAGANLGNKNTNNVFMSNGLVGYWKMEEGVGTTTLDSSGNNNTGTITGASWARTNFGVGLSFNLNNYLALGSLVLDNATVWSLNTQIKYINQNKNFEFFAGNNANTTTGKIVLRHNGYISFYGSNATYYDFSTPSTDIQNTSKNISFVSNGTNISLYIDGVFKSSVTPASTSISINQINNGWTDAVWTAAGVIDEVRIYNRALSATETLQLYKNFTQGGTNLKNSLIGYWKFDEGNGIKTRNNGALGSVSDGTLKNGPTWISDSKLNKGLLLDGLNDYVEVPNNNSLKYLGDNLSISLWVKLDSTDNAGRIMSKPWNGGGQYNYWIETPGGANPNLTFGISGSATYSLSFNQNITTDKWHHLTATVDTNKLVKLYIDGVLTNSGTHSISNWTPSSGDSNLPLAIGTYYPYGDPWAGITAHATKGSIDEVKIYNKALTDEEIKQDYNAGSAIHFGQTTQNIGGTTTSLEYCIPGDISYCASPVAEWKMDEGVGTSVVDTSGNNNTGTLINSPAWVQGKIGKGINFNGSNKRITISNPITSSGYSTVSLWYKRSESDSSTSWRTLIGHATANIHHLILNNTTRNIGIWDGGWRDFGYNPPDDNKWHHYEVIYNNGTNATLYVDGNYKNQITTTLNLSTNPIGSIGNYEGSSYWAGPIDHVKIYNYARTPAQIAYDYNKGGPVGWWKFDECQGNIGHDWSGNQNNGTINIGSGGSQNSLGTCAVGTSAAWTNGSSGKINSSLNFDGTDDYIDTSNQILKDNSPFTYSAWIKFSSSQTGKTIMGRHTNATGGAGMGIDDSSANKIKFHLNSYSTQRINSTMTLNDNNWHCITGTWDGANLKLYIDGNLNASNTPSTTLTFPSVNTQIGRWVGGSSQYFSGQIDDVRIYNYALTPEQVKQIYNGGSVSFN